VPIVRVNNIRESRIDTSDAIRVSENIEKKFSRSRLRGGEVLLTLVGTLGEVAIVPERLRGWNVARAVGVIPIRADPGRPPFITLILSALVFLASVLGFVAYTYPKNIMFADLGMYLANSIICSIAVVAVICAIAQLGRNPSNKYIWFAFLLLAALPLNVVAHFVHVASDQREASKREAWLAYGKALNPLITEYILSHPASVSFPGPYDRASIAGLGDYLRQNQSTIPIDGDNIVDPWGGIVWIIVEHSHSGELVAGQREITGVWHEDGNKIAIGLYVPNQHSLHGDLGEQWRVLQTPN
jgi:hypothetical protein